MLANQVGLSSKYVSERHAIASQYKMTAGEANKMFKKAKIQTSAKEIVEMFELHFGFHPEWHHSGFYKSSYGSTMGRTYFFSDEQVSVLIENWQSILTKKEQIEIQAKIQQEKAKSRKELQDEFLNANAVKINRVTSRPIFFYETNREMNGKYGWFSSYGKSYNMTEYYTGYQFDSEDKMNEFYKI